MPRKRDSVVPPTGDLSALREEKKIQWAQSSFGQMCYTITIIITEPRIATVMYENSEIGRSLSLHDGIIIEYLRFCFHSARTLHRRDEIECVSFKSNKNRESKRNSESDDVL